MDNINLMDAQKGDFQNVTKGKKGKVYRKVIDGYTINSSRDCKPDGGFTPWRYSCWFRFSDLAGGRESNRRLADLSPLVSLLLGDLKRGDLVDALLSDDGKEILEVVKVGHVFMEGNETDADQ